MSNVRAVRVSRRRLGWVVELDLAGAGGRFDHRERVSWHLTLRAAQRRANELVTRIRAARYGGQPAASGYE